MRRIFWSWQSDAVAYKLALDCRVLDKSSNGPIRLIEVNYFLGPNLTNILSDPNGNRDYYLAEFYEQTIKILGRMHRVSKCSYVGPNAGGEFVSCGYQGNARWSNVNFQQKGSSFERIELP